MLSYLIVSFEVCIIGSEVIETSCVVAFAFLCGDSESWGEWFGAGNGVTEPGGL